MQPAMAPFHDARLCDTWAPVALATPEPLEVFSPTMWPIAHSTFRVRGGDAFAKLVGHGASALLTLTVWRLRRVL